MKAKTGNLNEILDETDRIKNLDDLAVKEIFVKMKIWKPLEKSLTKKYRGRVNPLETDEFQNLLDSFKKPGLDWFIRDRLSEKYQDMKPKEIFEDIKKEDMEDREAVELARKKIARSVNGCCGLPIHKIVRSLIKAYDI